MTPSEFDALFESLGLSTATQGVDAQTTFVPLDGDETISSGPKEEFHRVAPTFTEALPKLQFSSPDAARKDADEPDLMPVEVLGEGGMGQVLLAHQTALNRHVAVKVLKPALANKAAAAALVHEARTAGGLEHPGVVPIYALARDAQGRPALVMKRVEGVSWQELMHTPDHPAWAKHLPSSRDRLTFHIEVLVQVCNAVAHAHQRGVLHRDVKPGNVLLGELGEVYLADWGVAASKTKTKGPATPERVRLVGTPAYLAPEMVTGEASRMDERTDVYLLGATLFEVLTGEPPHAHEDIREALQHAALGADPVFPPGVPPLLAAACKRALAADPDKRFQSATALRDELKRYLQHRSSSALAEAAAERLREMVATPADTLGMPFDERRWHALVFECRFGFTQALKDSPDHDEARDGLRQCLEVAARHEIARGHPGAARAFLSELAAPPAELKRDLEALERHEAQRSADAAMVRRLTHDLDPQVASRQRARLALGMGGAAMVMAIIVATIGSARLVAHGYQGWFRLSGMGLVLATYVIAAIVGRRSLFSTRINREVMALIGVAAFTAVTHRAFSVLFAIPLDATVGSDSIILSGFCALGALMFHRGFIVPALIFLCCTVGCLVVPERALNVFGVAAALAIGSFAVIFARWRWDRERRP
jgi:serine/threonine-protein kinase